MFFVGPTGGGQRVSVDGGRTASACNAGDQRFAEGVKCLVGQSFVAAGDAPASFDWPSTDALGKGQLCRSGVAGEGPETRRKGRSDVFFEIGSQGSDSDEMR